MCLDDDSQGRPLEVLWELELGAYVRAPEAQGLPPIDRLWKISARASLHAKCVVVDRRLTLVTSANFTSRGQTRNLEAGVLIDDATFAGLMLRQWRGLVDSGLVRRYGES